MWFDQIGASCLLFLYDVFWVWGLSNVLVTFCLLNPTTKNTRHAYEVLKLRYSSSSLRGIFTAIFFFKVLCCLLPTVSFESLSSYVYIIKGDLSEFMNLVSLWITRLSWLLLYTCHLILLFIITFVFIFYVRLSCLFFPSSIFSFGDFFCVLESYTGIRTVESADFQRILGFM